MIAKEGDKQFTLHDIITKSNGCQLAVHKIQAGYQSGVPELSSTAGPEQPLEELGAVCGAAHLAKMLLPSLEAAAARGCKE